MARPRVDPKKKRETIEKVRTISRADSIQSRGEFGLSNPGFVGDKIARDSLRISNFKKRKAAEKKKKKTFSLPNPFARLITALGGKKKDK